VRKLLDGERGFLIILVWQELDRERANLLLLHCLVWRRKLLHCVLLLHCCARV